MCVMYSCKPFKSNKALEIVIVGGNGVQSLVPYITSFVNYIIAARD